MTGSARYWTSFALLTALLGGCSEDDSYTYSGEAATYPALAGRPAPQPSSSSSSSGASSSGVNVLGVLDLRGTYSRLAGAHASSNGQLTGAVAIAERYSFSLIGTYEKCVTRQLVFPERERDSGGFMVLDDALRLQSSKTGTTVVKFEHDASYDTIWLDGKKFISTPGAQLCD
jgi:hypothetical protein